MYIHETVLRYGVLICFQVKKNATAHAGEVIHIEKIKPFLLQYCCFDTAD